MTNISNKSTNNGNIKTPWPMGLFQQSLRSLWNESTPSIQMRLTIYIRSIRKDKSHLRKKKKRTREVKPTPYAFTFMVLDALQWNSLTYCHPWDIIIVQTKAWAAQTAACQYMLLPHCRSLAIVAHRILSGEHNRGSTSSEPGVIVRSLITNDTSDGHEHAV